MSTKRHRRSLLQMRILWHLQAKPAKSVVSLAKRVHALRPSVSRSLHGLKRQGLVRKDGKQWHLTKAGKAQADIAAQTVYQTMKRVEKLWRTRYNLPQ